MQDNQDYQFISGMKLKENKLIITSSRLQNVLVGNFNGTDFKYRVMVIEDVKRLLQNTPCSGSSSVDGFENNPDGGFSNGGFTEGSHGSSHNGGSSGGFSHGGSSYSESNGGVHHGGTYGSHSHSESNGGFHHPSTPQSSGVIFKPKAAKALSYPSRTRDFAQNKFADSNDTMIQTEGAESGYEDAQHTSVVTTDAHSHHSNDGTGTQTEDEPSQLSTKSNY